MSPSSEGYLEVRGHRTWYRVAGDLRSGVPLVLLHGGPGIPGGTFEPLMERLAPARPVVRYDQLGCGRSDRPDDPSLWRVATFLDELTALRAALGLEAIHLLGHSWGGMLALEYLLTRPAGVRSLTLASSLCSTPLWVAEARRLRDAMPAHVAAGMRRFEAHHRPAPAPAAPRTAGRTRPGITPESVAWPARAMRRTAPFFASGGVQRLAGWASRVPPLRRAAYEIAGAVFLRRHVCRARDLPLVLCQAFLARNQQVYETMWGPSEFFATGVLADWTVESRLGEITVPTLITSGRHDEATPAQQERLRDGIPGARWTVFEDSAHFAFLEETDRYADALTAFLDGIEGA